MSAAKRVAEKFGGVATLAQCLGTTRDCVYRWGYPKEKRGSGGNIPSRWHKPILHAAKIRGIEINPEDLVNV